MQQGIDIKLIKSSDVQYLNYKVIRNSKIS
jgi:hypothetical protein